jgi:hypothetical protein
MIRFKIIYHILSSIPLQAFYIGIRDAYVYPLYMMLSPQPDYLFWGQVSTFEFPANNWKSTACPDWQIMGGNSQVET